MLLRTDFVNVARSPDKCFLKVFILALLNEVAGATEILVHLEIAREPWKKMVR